MIQNKKGITIEKTIYTFNYIKIIICGEPFQAWEMWLSPHSENQWGARLAGRTHVHGSVLQGEIRPALYLDCCETCSR